MTDAQERRSDASSVAVIIKSVCAWCSRVLRDGVEPATHGICDSCICKLCGITPEELSQRRREFEEEEG